MKWTDERKLAVLMSFHLLWGSVLWFSISKYGLGISTDSVHILFGGLNFSAGRGLISFDGSFLSTWPPLYPILLALVHRLSGLGMFATAEVLQAIAFIVLSLYLSLLFLKIFPGNFLLAFAGNALSDIGVVVLTSFNVLGSDYVQLAFIFLFIWLTGSYLENNSPRIFLALSVIGMLAMLQRYLGLAVIATGAASILFFSNGTLQQRIFRSSLISLSALPAGVWLLITAGFIERRTPISFSDNFAWFSKSILEWFFLPEGIKPHLMLYTAGLWILILGLIILLVLGSAPFKLFTPFTIPVFLFGILYTLLLFVSASVTYFNKLGGRFLLPLYIPLVALINVGVDGLLRFASENKHRNRFLRRAVTAGAVGAVVIVVALLIQVTGPIVLESHANGAAGGENVFNTTVWRENTVLEYWLIHPPKGNYLLFSNYPDGVAFYTRHSCYDSPRRYSGPYGKVEFPVSQYASQLFSSGQVVYLIWIEPNEYSYFYKVEDLSSIAQIEPLFVSREGGIYRLMPLSGS
jgi:hypothetical protein